MKIPTLKPDGTKAPSRWIIPILILSFAFIVIVLIPMGAYYLPTLFDQYGSLDQFASDATGVKLTYPARWQRHEQSFDGSLSEGGNYTHVVVTPPTNGNPIGGVEVWTYASKAAYLAKMNAGRQVPYSSLADFLASRNAVGNLSVAGASYSGLPDDGEAYGSLCFIISSSPRLHIICGTGTLTVQGLTAPQRLVLERAVFN